MSNLSPTAKEMIKTIAIACVAEIVIGLVLLFALDKSNYALGHILGILLGSLASAVKIIHLERSIDKSLDKGEKKLASNYYKMQYFVRTFFTLIVFAIGAVFHPRINIISVVIGVFNMNISAYAYKFIHKVDDSVIK
ncbi:ATP synthase subunit I [Tyzzerella sp. OttesenSCG-928-J15]|nr:ATP synthase subunit I [Tyzzerella sp. OttesenSCG-928-J15]